MEYLYIIEYLMIREFRVGAFRQRGFCLIDRLAVLRAPPGGIQFCHSRVPLCPSKEQTQLAVEVL